MKRKVLIIVENQTVPTDPRVLNEARSLQANGYQVTVLCPKRKRHPQGYELMDGIHVYRHPMAREGDSAAGYLWEYGVALLWEFFYTWWIYFRRGFHVIQACNPPDNIFLIALPFKLFGVKFIFDNHDSNPELYLSKYGRKTFLYSVLVWLEKMTYRTSDAVMVTNASYRGLAINRGVVAAENVFIVRNGPNLETFKAVPPKDHLKNGKRFMVGYVGCMGSQDGLDILVDVAEYLKKAGRDDVRFVCVGEGAELPRLRQMVKEKDIEDMIFFTGRISDAELLDVLSTADVCVNPDRPCEMNNISTMIKIMEYMALAKPIVQFESKEGRFSAGEASLYADKVDHVADFASKILWLLERPEERQRMGAFGKHRIETELAWDYSIPNLLAAYETALNPRGSAKLTELGQERKAQ